MGYTFAEKALADTRRISIEDVDSLLKEATVVEGAVS